MNRYNARANEFAVRQLSIQPKDRILEIGFGGELTIPAMPIQVTGIDRSEEMVRQAMHKFCKSVEAGRADFRAGNWKSFRLNQRRLATCSRSTRSISGHRLKPALMRFVVFSRPGGRAVIGFMPKEHMTHENMPTDIFTLRTENDITSAIKKSQFSEVRVERTDAASPWTVVVAIR